MDQLPLTITAVIAILTVFLCFIVVLKYAINNNFVRTRLIMSSFFFFIVITLSISFWPYTLATLPFTTPAAIVGAIIGYAFGVRTEQQKLRTEGLKYYMDHFAHIDVSDFKNLTWWSVINFYSVMGGLLMINLIGLSTVIFRGAESWAIFTSAVGAFLIGTIVPYLAHLWTIKITHHASRTTSDR